MQFLLILMIFFPKTNRFTSLYAKLPRIIDPSRIGRFYQHCEKFCRNAAVWRPCDNNFFFLLCAYFCETVLSWYKMNFSWMLKKNLNILLKKVLVCLKEPPFNPLNTLRVFFHTSFLLSQHSWKMHFFINSIFFTKIGK